MAVDAVRNARVAPVTGLGAVDLRDRIASGALSAASVADAFLDRVAAREGEIGAWAWIDPDFVRAQASHLDAQRRTGRPIGPLHGVPVGLKDIIDTARIPTRNGTPLDGERVPLHDAWIVERLKAAGAVIMGKTATTELAFLHPAPTRNPHAPDHTPGGSSAGSAAAVADAMVPLSVGTQTGGSVIRPASYCGVTGYKPSFGAIPRRGILTQSPFLDTVGVFAADPRGAALLAQVLFGHDPTDLATAPAPSPDLLAAADSAPPMKPVFAVIHPPGWEDAHPDVRHGITELADALGDHAFTIELPSMFADAEAERRRINFAEMAKHYHRYARHGRDHLSSEMQAAIEEGSAVRARDYLAALDWRQVLNAGLEEIFRRCDAILTPAATGPAPKGLASTGSAQFNGLWTLCGTPAITLPLLTSSEGLPMGVQLVGPRGGDARLLRTARWLFDTLPGLEGSAP